MVVGFNVLDDSAILKIANQMMDVLMLAFTEQDYERHIQYFSQRDKSILDATQFK